VIELVYGIKEYITILFNNFIGHPKVSLRDELKNSKLTVIKEILNAIIKLNIISESDRQILINRLVDNYEIDEYVDNLNIAAYSLMLSQPPDVIRRQKIIDLQCCAMLKEVENIKMEREMNKKKGSSVLK